MNNDVSRSPIAARVVEPSRVEPMMVMVVVVVVVVVVVGVGVVGTVKKQNALRPCTS